MFCKRGQERQTRNLLLYTKLVTKPNITFFGGEHSLSLSLSITPSLFHSVSHLIHKYTYGYRLLFSSMFYLKLYFRIGLKRICNNDLFFFVFNRLKKDRFSVFAIATASIQKRVTPYIWDEV